MNNIDLTPKIKKNLYELKHDKHLQDLQNTINSCLAIWLIAIGLIFTWVIQGNGDWIIGFMMGLLSTSIMGFICLSLYLRTNQKRKSVIDGIKELNI